MAGSFGKFGLHSHRASQTIGGNVANSLILAKTDLFGMRDADHPGRKERERGVRGSI